jgi:CheY-like chemotaxis protein
MTTSQLPQSLSFPTRAISPHGTITKKNFKEFSGTRILVAEDNFINQKVIRGLLADTGIIISMADDGQEALDILKKDDNFSMILMDAHMPRVDGFEATRTIRKNTQYNHIPIVALSGDIASDDIKRMKAVGMQEHLAKPLKISAFYDILYAYSKESTPQRMIQAHELDTAVGLNICGNDKEFYKEILNQFVGMYEDSTHLLGEYLHNHELKKADALLLDIIGLTANLGANSLHDIAQDIKAALKDTKEESYLTLVEHYKMQLENLIEDIKKYGQ